MTSRLRVYRGLEGVGPEVRPSVVTVGVFDGVHLGHRRVVGRAAELAREEGATLVALTFEPHPEVVLRGKGPPVLTPLPLKEELLRDLGVEALVVLEFSEELARVTPEEFARAVLKEALGAVAVVVGENFHFGHGARGDAALLKQLGRELGFKVDAVPLVRGEGVVSSSLIRESLARGDVEEAARALGRPHRLSGPVERGSGRGRALGFPTANIRPPEGLAIPAPGVYAVRAWVRGRALGGVANLGTRPTFGGGPLLLEVHFLEQPGELAGEVVDVEFLARIREERAFGGPEELKAQIEADKAEAERILEGRLRPGERRSEDLG